MHQLQVVLRFTLGMVEIGRALQVLPLTLFPDAELGMAGIDNPSPSRCAHILATFCKKIILYGELADLGMKFLDLGLARLLIGLNLS